jgi:protein O-mannosyl-transferase
MKQKKQQPAISGKVSPFSKREIMAVIFIITLGGIVYGRCVTYDYVLYDDPNIIFQNPNVATGLIPENIIWAFTNPNFGLYMPLPTLTFMLDSTIFGKWAGGFHLVTLAWHILCSCTLFIVFFRLWGNLAIALVTALIFMVHPVQAMTVNWISARNEIMPAFFALLSIEGYRQFALERSWKAFAASLLFMFLGLLSKQGIVLLPVIFLLLDYWPLRRINLDFASPKSSVKSSIHLAIEKIPWFMLSGAGIFLAFFGKMQFRILDKNNLMSPIENLGFAFTAYIRYLFHLIYPVNYLTAYSTATEWLTLWMSMGAFVALITITLLVILFYRRKPYLIVGWVWFVLLLLPVSGLVRYNSETIALRYLYAPAIGLYFLMVFLVYDFFRQGSADLHADDQKELGTPLGFKVIASILITILSVICFWQSGFWKNSEVLAQRALVVTNNTNAIAHNHLAEIRIRQGLVRQAEVHMRKAMELEPKLKTYTYNYAVLLMRRQRYTEALELLAPIVEESGHLASITSQYGAALLALNRLDEAQEYLEKAVGIDPNFVPALFNLAFCYYKKDEPDKAIKHLSHVLELQPDHPSASALFDQLK